MAKKVSKKLVENPTVSFEVAFANMLLTKSGIESIITLKEYTAIRKEMLIYHLGVKSLDSMNNNSVNYATDVAKIEYQKGFDGIEVGLRWLWDKYIAGKINNQMLAEFVFKILIKGIDDGIEAILNAIRKKKPDVADTVEDVLHTVDTVVADGSLDEFKSDVADAIEEIKKANQPSDTGEKKSLITRIWHGIKAMFRYISK